MVIRAYSLSCEALRTIFKAYEMFSDQRYCFLFSNIDSDRFELKNIPLEIHSLNKIVLSLCEKACLKKRSSYVLRVTCAQYRLFTANKKEELILARTGHISDALFRYTRNRIWS